MARKTKQKAEDNPWWSRIPIHCPVVQRTNNTVHQINHYLVDSTVCFVNTYSMDRKHCPIWTTRLTWSSNSPSHFVLLTETGVKHQCGWASWHLRFPKDGANATLTSTVLHFCFKSALIWVSFLTFVQQNDSVLEAISSNSSDGTPYQLWFGGNGLEVDNRSDM